jgi:tetratricopeptide (TPR) repeat protein/predicted aspartyl protease
MFHSPRFGLLCWLYSIGIGSLSVATLQVHAASVCKRHALELPVTIVGTRPVFAAKINDEDVRFVLDSGAFWSMISGAAAEQLKLKTHLAPYGLTVRGLGGTTTTPSVATVKSFNLAGASIANVEFLVGGSEVGSDSIGLLGQNFLERWDVEYDLAKGMVRLVKDEDCGDAMLAYWLKPDDHYSVMSISKTSPVEPHTSGSAYINGVKIRVIFDTGASTSVLSLKAAARAGVKLDSPGVVDLGYGWGIGRGMVRSYAAPFASLKFGDEGEEIQHARVRLADIELGAIDMLIGADFFLSHRIFVANSQRKLYFTYNGGPVFNLSASSSPLSSSDKNAIAATEVTQEKSDSSKLASEPADAAAFARQGAASAGRRDFEHALADLTRATELDPANPEYFYQRGRVYWEKGDQALAVADFNRVLELRPDHALALMSRAELRIAEKDFPGAIADLDSLDTIAAKPANVRLEMAHAYSAADSLGPAIAQYSLWIQSHGEDAQLAYALNGRCWDRALLGQDLAAALADCNKAVRLSVKGANAGILDSRGLVQLRLGDFDKAIIDYDASLQLRPNNAWSWYGRGVAKIRKNNRGAGEADIAHAEEIAPKIAEQFKMRGITP